MKRCSCDSMEKRGLEGVSSVNSSICQFAHSRISIVSHYILPLSLLFSISSSFSSFAEPLREWDWRMPASVYKELDFTDRAGVDRAVKIFQQAVDAERRGMKVTDLVPRYRAAAGEWRKVQVQAETAGGNEDLLAYSVFMQGYAKQQAHDRNEAVKLFTEVLDLYPEQKFVAIPARYLLSLVKRQLGDVRKADADLEEIVADGGADGHPLYYSILRTLAGNHWGNCRVAEAAELWEKIVSAKGGVDGVIRLEARNNLVVARTVGLDFANLESALFALIPESKKAERASAVADNAKWISDIDRYWNHGITQYLDRKYPREKKASERASALAKIRKGYVAWLNGEAPVFAGIDDGWTFALAQIRANAALETPEKTAERVKGLSKFVRDAKPDAANGRARTLATELLALGQKDAARDAAAMPKDTFARLRLQYDVEMTLGAWKSAEMYLQEFINAKPPPDPGAQKGAKYDLADLYRRRLSSPDKAVKIYQELNDPPRSLWGLAEALRESGKKKESYSTMTEIVSMFPDDAPNAVLRVAQWREQDGDKEKAISLYRQILKHPKWKQTGASSAAHQALERHGIATGGAMTNEVR